MSQAGEKLGGSPSAQSFWRDHISRLADFCVTFPERTPRRIIKLGSDDTPVCRTFHKCIVTVQCIFKYTHYITIYKIYIQIFASSRWPNGPRWSKWSPQTFEEWTHLAWEFHLFPRKPSLRLVRLLMAEILAPFVENHGISATNLNWWVKTGFLNHQQGYIDWFSLYIFYPPIYHPSSLRIYMCIYMSSPKYKLYNIWLYMIIYIYIYQSWSWTE